MCRPWCYFSPKDILALFENQQQQYLIATTAKKKFHFQFLCHLIDDERMKRQKKKKNQPKKKNIHQENMENVNGTIIRVLYADENHHFVRLKITLTTESDSLNSGKSAKKIVFS